MPQNVSSYIYARDHIPCACPRCNCPGAGGQAYTFRYIDEERKCIYFDVPKAASTTIRQKLGIGKIPHRTSLREPDQPLENYFKFAIVRNPWDRMFSNWKMFTSQLNRVKQLQSMTDADLSAFPDFVRFALQTPNHHWQPQSLYVPQDVDFVGKMEEMGPVLHSLSEKIPDFSATNEIRNSSKAAGSASGQISSYRELFTDETRALVEEFYADDIVRFGYTF